MMQPTTCQTRADNRQGGFTLLEVLVSVTILTIGLLGIAGMQLSAIRGNATARNMTEGVTWAQDRLEALLSLEYDDVMLDDDNAQMGGPTVYNDSNPPAGFALSWEVDVDNPVANCKQIAVNVRWQDDELVRNVRLVSLKSQ